MANWDFVLAYNEEFAEELSDQGYPHPPALEGNRVPSTADMQAVLA